jgi:hypothetical protein
MQRNPWTQLAAALILAGAFCGCARGTTGYRISDETVAFIHPGLTTRSDVVENLGPPLFELKNPHVVAYSWGRVRSAGGRPVVQEQMPDPGRTGYETAPPPSDEDSSSFEARRWICCVALDDKDRVTRFGTFEMHGAASLEQAVREWAAIGQP